MTRNKTIVVVGGGIAGISCIEALIQHYDSIDSQVKTIILITESRLVKKVTDYELSGRNIERFNVVEADADDLFNSSIPKGLNIQLIIATVTNINTCEKIVDYWECSKGDNCREIRKLSYDILCICNGSKPRQLAAIQNNSCPEIDKRVFVIRDTQTVEDFRAKLSNCRRLVIVGNGGISLGLINKIKDCEKIWIVRDESIGLTFFDSGAGKFLLDSIDGNGDTQAKRADDIALSGPSMISIPDKSQPSSYGPALGPNWLQDTKLNGSGLMPDKLDIHYRDEVTSVVFDKESEHQLNVSTKAGRSIDCDLIALAIGVMPNKSAFDGVQLEFCDIDGGILVDEQMRTSIEGIYAAGDVVSCSRWPRNDTWLQMRLWTQARQMGFYAGRCIACHISGLDPSIYFNFDCFTHCTHFFGYKVILLGDYNGQLLTDDESKICQVMARVNPAKDYVKIIIKDDRIIGAVLVGDSGLEETIENLIHDRLNVADCKDHLLDGTVDIEDYFD